MVDKNCRCKIVVLRKIEGVGAKILLDTKADTNLIFEALAQKQGLIRDCPVISCASSNNVALLLE